MIKVKDMKEMKDIMNSLNEKLDEVFSKISYSLQYNLDDFIFFIPKSDRIWLVFKSSLAQDIS